MLKVSENPPRTHPEAGTLTDLLEPVDWGTAVLPPGRAPGRLLGCA